MLDMFELDGGLKARSLSKVVFSEIRDSQMGRTNLFTHPEPKKQRKQLFVDFGDLHWTRLNWMVGWKLKVSEKLALLVLLVRAPHKSWFLQEKVNTSKAVRTKP